MKINVIKENFIYGEKPDTEEYKKARENCFYHLLQSNYASIYKVKRMNYCACIMTIPRKIYNLPTILDVRVYASEIPLYLFDFCNI